MATEIIHGPKPRWTHKVSGEFNVLVQGHYTDHPTTGCVGVADYAYQSQRAVKRQAELLVLRQGFVDWFMKQWVENGGTEEEARSHIKGAAG